MEAIAEQQTDELYEQLSMSRADVAAYREALKAVRARKPAEAIEPLNTLIKAHPQYVLLRHHLVSAMLGAEQTEPAMQMFRELQVERGLEQQFRKSHRFLHITDGLTTGHAEPARPAPEEAAPYRVLTTGKSELGQAYSFAALTKSSDGSRVYELDLEDCGPGFVFEALIKKHTGDDECFRIEVDYAGFREVLTINGGLCILGSTSTVARVNSESQFRYVRLELLRDESRLYVDGWMVTRSAPLPATSASRLRFGLFEGHTSLDTCYYFGSAQVAWGSKNADRLPHPYPDFTKGLTDLGFIFAELGAPSEALTCVLDALNIDPSPAAMSVAELAISRASESLELNDPQVRRCLEVLAQYAGPARAAAVKTVIRQKHHDIAIACHNVSIYFAKVPDRITRPFEILKRLRNPDKYFQDNYRWTVRDVSFELRYGDVLAIIGNNGAGKSTLLRAIAGILDYEGEMIVNGKPRLLVMGLGVQEELSARENILLGCMYLGMRKKKILPMIDGILDFAELTEVGDLPYKYFSDGMRARLLFAIATSIEPDILLLDELLGAGDVTFRNKAMSRMDQLLASSKAMVVVTHNLTFVREKAKKALYLGPGKVLYCGDPNKAVDMYLEDSRILKAAAAEKKDTYLLREI